MRLYSLCLAACFGLMAIALPVELVSPVHESRVNAETIEERRAEGDRLNEQGLQQFQDRQIVDAIRSWQAALAIFAEIGEQFKTIDILNQLGRAFFIQGQYQQAKEIYVWSLSTAREVEYRQGEVTALNGLGNSFYFLGQIPDAIQQHQQALEIARHIESGEEEAIALNGLGNAYSASEANEDAIEFYEASLEASRRISYRAGEARALNNLGRIHTLLEKYEQAVGFYEQALRSAREANDSRTEAVALDNIATTYIRVGQYQGAIDLYAQSLEIYQSLDNRESEGNTIAQIGIAYRNLDQHERAIEYHFQSLRIAQELSDRHLEAVSYGNLGVSSNFLGRYQQALDFHQQALAIYQDIEFREGEGLTLGNLGLVYNNLGDHQQAISFYRQSLMIAKELNDRLREGNAFNNIGLAYLNLGQYANASDTLLEAIYVYETYLRSGLADANKISIFDTYVRSYRLLQVAFVAQNRLEDALLVAEQSKARALVDLLSTRLDRSNSTLNISLDNDEFNLETIRQISREQNAVLVQYSLVETSISSRVLYIWVVKPSGEIDFRSLSLATLEQPLSELVSTSRESIGVGNRGATVRPVPSAAAQQQREAEQRQKLQQLHQLLIGPVQDLLPTNAEEPVIFIPHSELFLVPFPALMSAEGRYLIQDHTILTAPSIQVLQFTHQIGQSNGTRNRSTSADQVLVVGNPIMPTLWSPDEQTSEPLPSLPGAEEEAIAISTLFNTEPLMWDEASESTVVERMESAQVIHLATHGLLEYGNPQESGVRDFPGAIALAPDNTNDGLLTSSEILDLNLNAELVVLSACDTGRGNLTSDGVIGLSRSLISAGVPSIIVSLWAVDDNATSELMQEFYRRWRTNEQPLDKAQALRQAMLTTMQTHPDPKDWAAFTLIGERE